MDECSSDALVNAIEFESHPEVVDELLGSLNSSSTDNKTKEEDKLRQKLRFFFMNPIEKWHNKQRFPYKFFIQLIKIIVVTLQSYMFAHHRTTYIDYVTNNKFAFSHLFLQGWDSSREIISYPPQSGDLALYKSSDFYSAIDFAVVNFANLDDAVGSYSYIEADNGMAPLQFCFDHYKACDIFGFNESYIFNSEILRTCININITKADAQNFSSEEYFRRKNQTVYFPALVEGRLSFGVKTVNLKPAGPRAHPDCFEFNLTVVFDNEAHDGKMKISLETDTYRLHCKGNVDYINNTKLESLIHTVLNVAVIICCIISFCLCSRALYRANNLRLITVNFFKNYYNKVLSKRDQLEFLNFWYVTMISSDCLTIIGSGLKEKIEKNEFSGDEWNTCSVMLGSGMFLIWFCVLRYLGFFKTYNVVILTLKVAAPVIVRFMVCTMLIYAGFTFCGWLVLGPYHTKFKSLSETAECLFALLNGDDVFGTFNTLEPTKSELIWWFSRIYLYMFVSFFIYVILSLFVSVILDAYETIKRYYSEGFPKNEIQEFIDGGFHHSLVSESSSSLADDLPQWCGSCRECFHFFSFFCPCRAFKQTKNTSVPES